MANAENGLTALEGYPFKFSQGVAHAVAWREIDDKLEDPKLDDKTRAYIQHPRPTFSPDQI